MTTKADIRNGIAYERKLAREEGLAEGGLAKARETARNLKAAGIGIELISQCTGLSIEEVTTL